MKERIIIVFIAVILGIVITTGAFLIYQSTKKSPTPNTQTTNTKDASPIDQRSQNEELLSLSEPAHESLTDNRTVTVNGTTKPEYVIIVSSNQDDVVAIPNRDGSFSTTITIDAGSNIIQTRAVAPDGTEILDERVVTFIAEEF